MNQFLATLKPFKWAIIGGIIAVVILLLGGMSCSYRNDFVRSENAIIFQDKEMQNVFTIMVNNMKSQGLNQTAYKDAVIQAIDKAIQGRYGANGAQQAILFLKEDNPKIDPATYTKMANVIEAGYARFEAAQRKKIDLVRIYKNKAEMFPGALFASILGFPRKPWEELERIITSGTTKKTWETGEMDAVDPYSKDLK